MYQEILYDVADPVATIRLNRPQVLNAWTNRMGAEVKHALAQAEADRRVVAIVLTGAGRGFCSGADLKKLQGLSAGEGLGVEIPPELEADPGDPAIGPDFRGTYTYLMSIRKPVIAALNGVVAGMAVPIALACDLRFCSEQARFVTAFAKIGLSGDYGGSYFLQRLISYGRALELYLLAEPIDAPRALQLGIANHVVPHDALMARGLEYCARLAAGPTHAYGNIKAAFSFSASASAGEALRFEAGTMADSARSQDFAQAAKAWAEGRKPEFRGR